MLTANETLYSRAFMLPAQWGRMDVDGLGSFNPLAFTLAVNNGKGVGEKCAAAIVETFLVLCIQ